MSVAGEASGHFTSPEFILVMPVSSKGTETETSTETEIKIKLAAIALLRTDDDELGGISRIRR